jgi:hypothetical protein
MGHLRLSNEVIEQRGSELSTNGKAGRNYLFTQSHWHAVQYVGDGRLVLETGYVDPNTVFPWRVMRNIDYGIARGFQAVVTEYAIVDEEQPCGAIVSLRDSGDREIGHYAIRYAGDKGKARLAVINARASTPTPTQTHAAPEQVQ